MRWQVTGLNSLTGIEQCVVVEADDEKRAAALARAKGILPTSATPIGPPAPVQAPPLNYASMPIAKPSDSEMPRTPGYAGLGITALLCLVAGLASVARGAYLLLAADADPEEHVMVFSLMLCGLLLCFAAFAGHALRDIARNSWPKQ